MSGESIYARLEWCAEAFDEMGYTPETATVQDALRILAPKPEWDTDGTPANLAAAVTDAGEWLDLLTQRADWLNLENRERCRAALAALLLHSNKHSDTLSESDPPASDPPEKGSLRPSGEAGA